MGENEKSAPDVFEDPGLYARLQREIEDLRGHLALAARALEDAGVRAPTVTMGVRELARRSAFLGEVAGNLATSQHSIKACRHGRIVDQCRCAFGAARFVETVECPPGCLPAEHHVREILRLVGLDSIDRRGANWADYRFMASDLVFAANYLSDLIAKERSRG